LTAQGAPARARCVAAGRPGVGPPAFVETTDRADVIVAKSAMLMYRQRGHDAPGDVIPVRRRDELRLTSAGVRLLKRDALITEAVLQTPNLGVFL
jgi:N,N-dimethyl phenylurea N-demethylase beta subunit